MLWNWKFKLPRRSARSFSATARWLVARMVLVASLAALLALAGHYQVQRTLDRQGHDRTIAGIAGRQRILGQRIAKSALLIQAAPPGPHRQHLAIELRQLLDLWSHYQMALAQGDAELALPAEQSNALDTMYADLHSVYVAIETAARPLIDAGRRPTDDEAESRSVIKAAADIQRFERRFLEGMDRIMHQYEAESRAQAAQLTWMQRALLVLALAALPLAGWWIVWPAAKQLERDAQELADLRQKWQAAGTAAQADRRDSATRPQAGRSDLTGQRSAFRPRRDDLAGVVAAESFPASLSEFSQADALSLVVALQAAAERDDQVILDKLVSRLRVQLENSTIGEQAAAAAEEVQQVAASRDRRKIVQTLDRLQRRLKQPAASPARDARQAAAVA
jgi:hypothetical protein